jgi:predicted dehydrogenase
VQVYSDGGALIAEADVDLIDLCLPTYLHAGFTEMAADAGRHIVVEKPMALSSAEAQRMIEAARRSRVELMVAQCVRFWPEYQFLRAVVEDGRLGKLLKADFSRHTSRPTWCWQNWMLDKEHSGGAVLDMHVHDVDFVNFMLGAPGTIYATGVVTPVTGGYDLVTALYSYKEGPQVTVEAAWYMAPGYRFRARYLAAFEGGVIRYDSTAQPSLVLFPNETREVQTPDVSGDAYFNELKFLIDALRQGESLASVIPPESARRSLELIELEISSMESGAPVHLS